MKVCRKRKWRSCSNFS